VGVNGQSRANSGGDYQMALMQRLVALAIRQTVANASENVYRNLLHVVRILTPGCLRSSVNWLPPAG